MGDVKERSHYREVLSPYTMGQLHLPTDLGELVSANHLVWVVRSAM